MNDETEVQTTTHRCPDCGGMIQMEVRSAGGGKPTSVSYECRDCRTQFTHLEMQIAMMRRRLEEWVPAASEVHGPTFYPKESREFVRWRCTFPDGVVAQVSFRSSDVENSLDELWSTIQDKRLLRGGSGSFRVESQGIVRGDPVEWDAASDG